jgi:hypothetical protein
MGRGEGSVSLPDLLIHTETALNTHWTEAGWALEPVWKMKRRENSLVLPGKNRVSIVDQSVTAGLSPPHSEVQFSTLGTRIYVYCVSPYEYLDSNFHLPYTYFSVHGSSRFERVLELPSVIRTPVFHHKGFGQFLTNYSPIFPITIVIIIHYFAMFLNVFVL